MAADNNSVKLNSHPAAGSPDEHAPEVSPWERTPPGITVSELIAKVGNLTFPDHGFADNLEAVQALQPLAEMPEWPDWPQTATSDGPRRQFGGEP